MALNLEAMHISDVSIYKAAEFNGYHIQFSALEQRFQFLVGKGASLVPFGIKHVFTKQQTCKICEKKINAVPVGQQICPVLQNNRNALLEFFQTHYSKQFED